MKDDGTNIELLFGIIAILIVIGGIVYFSTDIIFTVLEIGK